MSTAVIPNTKHSAADRFRVLVSDDQPDILEALRLLLKGAGFAAETVDSPQALLRAVEARPFDAILMDLNYARDTTSARKVWSCSINSRRSTTARR